MINHLIIIYTCVCLMDYCTWFLYLPIFRVAHVKEVYCLYSYDQTLDNACLPYFHFHAITSSAVITGLITMMRRKTSNVFCVIRLPLFGFTGTVEWHFGTTLASGHLRHVNNLVFWINDATASAASSVLGCDSDMASGVARMELRSFIIMDLEMWAWFKSHVSDRLQYVS